MYPVFRLFETVFFIMIVCGPNKLHQGSPKYGPRAGSGPPRSPIQPTQCPSDGHLKSLLMIGTTNSEPQLDVIFSETRQFRVSHSSEKNMLIVTLVLHHN